MNKLYIVSNSYYPNTASTNRLMGMINAFSQMGINVDVVFFMPDKDRSKAPKIKNVRYHYYWKYFPITSKFRFILYQFLYSFLFYLKLKKRDTVYIYTCDNLLPILSQKNNIRLFYERTEHTNFSRMKFLNYNNFFKACSKIDGLFLISEPLRNHFISRGVPKELIHIINMTVDSSRFENLIKEEKSGKYIAYCGSASNNKDGVDLLIRSFAIIHRTFPKIKLYIIGDSPKKEDKTGNLRLIKQLGLSEYIVFTGIVGSDKVPQLLKNAEVLLLNRPDSIQAQCGFPTKLGEYLLTENPVVVSNVGDISKFLEDKVSARLSRERDIEDFAEKVIWCLENQEEAKLMGINGKNVALRHFNSFTEAKKMYSVMFPSN